MSVLPGPSPRSPLLEPREKIHKVTSSTEHERNAEHAEEIQTNTVVFASQIHKEREGGSVNTHTTVPRNQEAFDRTSPGRALLRVIPTETHPRFGTDGTRRLGGEVQVCPE